MYEAFFNLSVDPFRLLPDPGICFPHKSCARAWAYLRYAVKRGEGIVVITGRPGSGKTTLAQRLLTELNPSKTVSVQLIAHDLSATDLLRKLAYAFGLPAEGMDRAMLAHRIERYLAELERSNRRALVVIDEAQTLSHHALEAMRLLTDLQSRSRPVLQMILLGQNELEDVMSAPGMEQFQHRVIASCRLQTMDLKETKSYLEYRLAYADWRGDPSIDGTAVMAIYRNSNGLPRHVNKICSRLFLHASSEEIHEISEDDVQAVVSDLKEELLAPLTMGDAVASEPLAMPDSLDELALVPGAEPAAPHPYACAPEAHSQSTLSGLYPDDDSSHPYAPAPVAAAPGDVHGQPYQDMPSGGEAGYPYQAATPAADGAYPYPPEDWTDAGQPYGVRDDAGPLLEGSRDKARQLTDRIAQWTPLVRDRLRRVSASLLQHLRDTTGSLGAGSGKSGFKGMRPALFAGLAILVVAAVVVIVARDTDVPADAQDGHTVELHSPPAAVATVAESPSVMPRPVPATGYQQSPGEDSAVQPALPEPQTAELASAQVPAAESTIAAGAEPQVANELAAHASDPAGPAFSEAPAKPAARLFHDTQPGAVDDVGTQSMSAGGADIVDPPLPQDAPASPQLDQPVAAVVVPDEPLEAASAPLVPEPTAALESNALPGATLLPETDAEPPQADTADEAAAVLAEVERLNVLAAKALARYRLLLPEDDNAYGYYRRVLALDPDNGEAYAGLSQIVQKYGEMAENSLDKNDLVKAELYVERALSVDPGHSESLILRDRIERAIADVEATRQAAAERAAAESEAARQRRQESPAEPKASSPGALESLMWFVGGNATDADQ